MVRTRRDRGERLGDEQDFYKDGLGNLSDELRKVEALSIRGVEGGGLERPNIPKAPLHQLESVGETITKGEPQRIRI
ncbi:hypothetical protein F2Q69_00029827 [Brassica cretica]|uniref:Uncharacterized protein n=1 Tax=Brassica cretica TaxID=69181 RepID=A0A8S9S1X8_BRACR|nr:hypothetical protein F2Q69_00029827 [Brassica cretica]